MKCALIAAVIWLSVVGAALAQEQPVYAYQNITAAALKPPPSPVLKLVSNNGQGEP
jgi:hypothetical protein